MRTNLLKLVYLRARAIALRLVAKRGVRRMVMPLVGLVQGFRLRHLAIDERWQRSLGWEASFWDDFLRSDAAQQRIDAAESLTGPPMLLECINRLDSERVRILDVGAGPITNVGRTMPGKTLEVVATDALAHEYDHALARAGIVPPVRTIFAHAECLTDTLSPDSFDVAYCANALDHCYDPVQAIDSMLTVVRLEGFVVLQHFVDEGRLQSYTGLHQWNITESDGALVIWNRTMRENITERIASYAQVKCRRVPDPRGSRLECAIWRTGSDVAGLR